MQGRRGGKGGGGLGAWLLEGDDRRASKCGARERYLLEEWFTVVRKEEAVEVRKWDKTSSSFLAKGG